jgi:putative transposase
MASPRRGNTGYSTYFVRASTFQRLSLFQSERMARLFLDVLFHYRRRNYYLLHAFVLMPNHFHLLLTPTISLERSLQVIKGGFSYRARKELLFGGEIWETSFYDRRVRNLAEYRAFVDYIHQNPVKARLTVSASEYPYSSACRGFALDGVPQRLKPRLSSDLIAAP